MKKITTFVFLFLLSFSVTAKENYPKLKEVKGLASISNFKTNSSFDKSVDLKMDLPDFSNEKTLLPLSNKKADKNEYAPKKFNFSIMPYAWFAAIGGT
ncbi:MAG TPA: hypothetical protein PKC58_17245, partial [Ignavibacteria bacterium]|nr:hypothetical protein [Ignavibacteria bacterium]